MHSRDSRAADGMSSVSSACVELNLRLSSLARKDPRASAANSGTVIKEYPSPSRRHRDGECGKLQYQCRIIALLGDARQLAKCSAISAYVVTFSPVLRAGRSEW